MRRLFVLAALLISGSILNAQKYSFTTYPTSENATWNASADFNRDGYPDIAVVNAPAPGTSQTHGIVQIFFNNHKGGLDTPRDYSLPDYGPIVAVDVNGDGWPDLVIAGSQAGSNTILLNNGDGTFRVGPPLITAGPVVMFVAGDFNNDGKVDLAAVLKNDVEILKNNGNSTFTSIQTLSQSGANLVARDFDGDGHLDLAYTNGKFTYIWWGTSTGFFTGPLALANPSSNPLYWVASADFNNDGYYDLAVTSNYPCPDPTNFCGVTTAHVYKSLGKERKFSLVSSYSIGDDAYAQIYTADVNSDLNQDLVSLNTSIWDGEINYRPGNGNFGFGTEVLLEGTASADLGFRDFNLDSRADIFYPEFFPSGDEIVGIATSGPTNCAGLGSAKLAAKICSPAANATVTSPVLIRAAGNSPLGVKRLEVWVDGVKVYQKLSDQLAHKLTLSPGKHRVSVVAVDQYTGYSKTIEYLNVQ